MAGTTPTLQTDALSLIQSQSQGYNPGGAIAVGGSTIGTSGTELGLSATEATGVAAVIGIVGAGIAAIFAAHKKNVQREAQTLNNAVPRWRQMQGEIADAYNQGQINLSQAYSYVDQAVQMYYDGVRAVPMKGTPPHGGAQAERFGGPAGNRIPNPCNGPCEVAYYWVEPEALQLKKALADADSSGGSVTVPLGSIPPHAGFNGEPASNFVVQKPAAPLAVLGDVSSSFANYLPANLRQYSSILLVGLLLLVFFGVASTRR